MRALGITALLITGCQGGEPPHTGPLHSAAVDGGSFAVPDERSLDRTRDHAWDGQSQSIALDSAEIEPFGCTIVGGEAGVVIEPLPVDYDHTLMDSQSLEIRLAKKRAEPAEVVLTVVGRYPDAADKSFEFTANMDAGEQVADVSIPLQSLQLPTHSLEVSRQLHVHAVATYSDGFDEPAGGYVRLYFHPEAAGWTFYSESKLKSEYWGGALTVAERGRRQEALDALAAEGEDVASFHFAVPRVTKLSDDPTFLPNDDL